MALWILLQFATAFMHCHSGEHCRAMLAHSRGLAGGRLTGNPRGGGGGRPPGGGGGGRGRGRPRGGGGGGLQQRSYGLGTLSLDAM